MMNIGPMELLIVGAICLGGLALPLANLVFLYMILERVRRIEKTLDERKLS